MQYLKLANCESIHLPTPEVRRLETRDPYKHKFDVCLSKDNGVLQFMYLDMNKRIQIFRGQKGETRENLCKRFREEIGMISSVRELAGPK